MPLPSWHPYKDFPPTNDNMEIPWSPAALSPALWIDASDPSTITLVDSKISEIRDKSGNGIYGAQGTATARPTLTTVNGKQAMLFSGGQYLDLSVDVPLEANHFFIAVYTRPSVGIHSVVLSAGLNSATVAAYPIYWYADNSIYFQCGITAGKRTSPTTETGTAMHAVQRLGSLIQYAFSADNVMYGLVAHSPVTGSMYSRIGARYLPSNEYMTGAICEFLLINKVLSQEERNALAGYLAHRWRPTTSLPATHKYISAPPIKPVRSIASAWTPRELNTALWLDSSGRDSTYFNSSAIFATSNIVFNTFCAIFVVLDTSSITSTQVAVEHAANYATYSGSFLLTVGEVSGNINYGFRYGGGNYVLKYPISNGKLLLSLLHNGTRSITVSNNGSEVAGTTIDISGTVTAEYTSNQPVYIGARSGNSYPLSGPVRELIILNFVPPIGISQLIEGYLAHKWDKILGETARVTALPATHPCKVSAPMLPPTGIDYFTPMNLEGR